MMTQNKDEGGRMKDEGISTFILHPSSFDALQRAALTLADLDAPRLTAEVLLAHVLSAARAQLLSRPERIIPPRALAEYDALVARAAAGEPLAYLTGQREFCGLDFLVDSRVLIPRPETELLIELALSPRHPVTLSPDSLNILDVGTGSGCLAITLAVRRLSARITALDISADALALARLNAERHAVADRITFVQSDLLSNLHPPTPLRFAPGAIVSNYQLLIANLPYIPSGDLPPLPFARYEPLLALDGGSDGCDLFRRLLADAPRVMAPQGCLLLEINDEKSAAALDLARAAFPAAHIELHKDFAGLDRVVSIAL